MAASVLTVSQVNYFLKSLIEGDGRLNNILITGEISNFTDHYKSGHLYFSLKDEKSVMKAVMFAGSAKRLKFRPENGMKVIIRGRVCVYEPSGQYQLYAEEMQPDGIGALSIAYEQLKSKLEGEGLFDNSRKQPIPHYPSRIGVITSPTGAAVRDILQITARRWPIAQIVFCPVLVQGEGAPRQLIRAINRLNEESACEVIILGRGGGSLEDLWAFNDEGLARAIYNSKIPIISAVGHETDYTISDFTADMRAPTPSAAAELCTPEIYEEKQRIIAYNRYFHDKSIKTVEYLRQAVDILVQESPLRDPEEYIESYRERVVEITENLVQVSCGRLEMERTKLSVLCGKLDALSPLKVLSRGYAVVYDEDEMIVRDVGTLHPGDRICIRTADATVSAQVLEGDVKNGG